MACMAPSAQAHMAQTAEVAHTAELAQISAPVGSPTDTLRALQQQMQVLQQRLADGQQAQQQLLGLQQRLDQLERRLDAPTGLSPAPATAPQATQNSAQQTALQPRDLPKSVKLGATSVAVTGVVWPIASVSSRSAGPLSPGDDFLILSQIPVGPGAAGQTQNKFKLGAKATRFGVKTLTPSGWGPISTLLELDFFGGQGNVVATNSYAPRLRHAWVSVGGLGAGQTWSNLLNVSALPELFDPAPPIGWFGGGARQAQLRWTSPTAADGSFWAVSAENPETYLGTPAAQDSDKLPDVTGKVHFGLGQGQFELAGALRRLSTANPGGAQATGYGLGFGGALPLTASTSMQFSTGLGRGLGRYWGGIVADATRSDNSPHTLQLISHSGGFVSVRHFFSPTLRSNLIASWLVMRLPGAGGLANANANASASTLDRNAQTLHLNLVWTPVAGLDVGLELMRARRELGNGQKGDLTRYLVGAKYAW